MHGPIGAELPAPGAAHHFVRQTQPGAPTPVSPAFWRSDWPIPGPNEARVVRAVRPDILGVAGAVRGCMICIYGALRARIYIYIYI